MNGSIFPRNWGELIARFAYVIGGSTWEFEANAWLAIAIMAMYDDRQLDQLSPVERQVAFNRCGAMLLHLEAEEGDLAFSTETRNVIRAAFAKAWDGLWLEGPGWALDQGETDRPRYGKWLEQQALADRVQYRCVGGPLDGQTLPAPPAEMDSKVDEALAQLGVELDGDETRELSVRPEGVSGGWYKFDPEQADVLLWHPDEEQEES